MPKTPVINQLDPFGSNEDEYQTKEIRHSRSRSKNNFFINLINPEDEKVRKRNHTVIAIVLLLIIFGALAVLLIPNFTQPATPSEPETLVNPTGREAASSENLPAFDDPETRAYEQEKLDTVLALTAQDDWEYTNALFETIFPDDLDDCGKYDYYRAAIILSENVEGFAISHDVATARAEELVKKCNRGAATPSNDEENNEETQE